MNPKAQSEAPSVVTPQDIRDIFNRYGMNYSQIVGEENTVVSASLYTYNKAIDEIVAKINRLITEARIDELEYVSSDIDGWLFTTAGGKEQDIEDRIKELSNNLSKEVPHGEV